MKEKIIKNVEWLIGFLLVLVVVYGSYSMSKKVVSSDTMPVQIDVILDAGHGGRDPGKVGVNGELEKDINLQIVQKVEKLLQAEGISIVLTRDSDIRVDENGTEYSKMEDMKNRVELINRTNPDLVVSVHQNSYPDETVKGGQVFYFSDSEESCRYAGIMQEAIRKVDPANDRQAKGNAEYYLLTHAECPVIIVECGFLSNWEEAGKLSQEEYQKELAQAIADGVKSCLETTSQNENDGV